MNENFENLSDKSSYACRPSDKTFRGNEVKSSEDGLDDNKEQSAKSESKLEEGESLSSSYINVSGYRSNVLSRGSMSYVSVDGTNMLSDIASECELDDDNEYDDINYSGVNCFFCLRDGNIAEATHVCHSCQPGGRYICHRCLQQHNKFCEEHDVISLSVIYKQEPEFINQTIEKTNSEKGSTESNNDGTVTPKPSSENLSQIDNVDQEDYFESYANQKCVETVLEVPPKTSSENLGQTEHVDQEDYHESSAYNKCIETVLGDPEKVSTSKQEIATTKDKNSNKNTRYSPLPFFKDKLLLKIACDQQGHPKQSKKISKYGSYNIKTPSDLKRCFITSMTQLDQSHLLLADSENKSLKLIQAESFKLISSNRFKGHPNCVCALDDSLAAVLIDSREIAILSIGNEEIEQITSFITGADVSSITKDTGGLYVCFCDKIVFYTYTGEVDISRYSIPLEKSKKNYNFRQIAGCSDQQNIFVTDLNHGILLFDKCGVLLWTLSDVSINKPTAMCIDQNDTIYVTDTENSAFQIIINNDTKSFVIEPIQDIEQAYSLCFEKIHNRLVVGQWCSDFIQVFSVM